MQKPKGFVDISGYEGLYAVSKNGEILSYPNSKHIDFKILKPYFMHGYGHVRLFNSKKIQKIFKVHRLVANAFIPNPQKKLEINHKNHIRNDNRIENLEWCTRSENTAHTHFKKFGSLKHGSKYRGVVKFNNRWYPSITFNSKRIYLGGYSTENEAADVYNKKALELFGKFAYLNPV